MNGKLEFALVVLLAALAGSMALFPAGGDGIYPLQDVDGRLHGSLANAETNSTVLFFLNTSCPISMQYAPEIIRICNDYRSTGAGCFLVYPESRLTRAELNGHLQSFGHTSPAILDAAHALVEKAGATVTPEAAVFSRTGALLYRGRIDDRHVDFGIRRREAQQRDLRDALDAVAAGSPVKVSRTTAVGCFIEPLSE